MSYCIIHLMADHVISAMDITKLSCDLVSVNYNKNKQTETTTTTTKQEGNSWGYILSFVPRLSQNQSFYRLWWSKQTADTITRRRRFHIIIHITEELRKTVQSILQLQPHIIISIYYIAEELRRTVSSSLQLQPRIIISINHTEELQKTVSFLLQL